MLIVLRDNPSGELPLGWCLADKEEAKARRDNLVDSFGHWDICALADGCKIDDPGYGGKILKQLEGEAIACQVITPIKGEMNSKSQITFAYREDSRQESELLPKSWQ